LENKTMLQIKNLHASVENKSILKGINLEVKAGEIKCYYGTKWFRKKYFSISYCW